VTSVSSVAWYSADSAVKTPKGSSKGCVLEAGAIFFMRTERFDRLTIPNAVEGPSPAFAAASAE